MIEFTAMLTSRSPFGCQLAPLLVDFQMPPATPAVHIRLFCVRWMSSARERPPMLPGPCGCQLPLSVLASVIKAVEDGEVNSEGPPDWLAVEYTGIWATSAAASSSAETPIGWPLGERFCQ